MQITETVSEGLRREYHVVVPQGDLDAEGHRAPGRDEAARAI